MSEMRIATVNGERIDYVLTRKRMRNMRMRVTAQCMVTVSCPIYTSISDVENFIAKHILWIKESQAKIRADATNKERYEYMTGESFLYLGEKLTLMAYEGDKKEVIQRGGYIFMTIADLWDFEAKRALLDKWYKQQAESVFAERFYSLIDKHKDLFPDSYTLKIKKGVSTWGKCAVYQKVVTLNFNLIYAPIELIDSVILHELCHFYHINHDKNFYDMLFALDPFYKEHNQALGRKYIDYTHYGD